MWHFPTYVVRSTRLCTLCVILTDMLSPLSLCADSVLRQGICSLSTFLGIEASRNLEESSFEGVRSAKTHHTLSIQCSTDCSEQVTPVSQFTGSVIKPRIGLTPLLRAGLGMTDAMLDLFPYVNHLLLG